jgi:hypothetical protein
MINSKGAQHPKDIILYAVFFMCSMAYLIVILKRLWQSEEYQLITLH